MNTIQKIIADQKPFVYAVSEGDRFNALWYSVGVEDYLFPVFRPVGSADLRVGLETDTGFNFQRVDRLKPDAKVFVMPSSEWNVEEAQAVFDEYMAFATKGEAA